MRLVVNGHDLQVDAGTTVAELIATVAGSTRGSAAVVDDEVVPRSTWHQLALRDGQTVELITAVQGG